MTRVVREGDPPLAMADGSETRHPRLAFLLLLFTEVWERFGYYGMSSIAVLYMVERVGLGDARADLIWGAFSAMVYSLPILGGYIGDRILGARRTLVLGLVTLALGYLLLSIPLADAFFPGLGLIALGNGLYKVNPSNLVSRLYEGDRNKLDILFTLYYMALNIGAFFSILLLPWMTLHSTWLVRLGPLRFDSWHLAFGTSALGLLLGLLGFLAWQHRYLRFYGTAADFRGLDWRKLAIVIAVALAVAWLCAEIIQRRAAALGVAALALAVVIVVFARVLRDGDQRERRRMWACVVFTLILGIWAIYNQQIYTSLTLFALRNVQHRFLGFQVSPAQFQDLNQFWLVVLAVPLAWFYHRMQQRARGDFSMASKYAVGLYLTAAGFFLYAASGLGARAGVVSPWWLVAGYGAQSFGELLISALSTSMVAQFAPERARGVILGAALIAVGVSSYAGSAIASLARFGRALVPASTTVPVYMHLFGALGLAALVCAVIVSFAVPALKRLAA
ncbi:MAG: peptide MFS transporter [Gammaproteobacteria bacterium]